MTVISSFGAASVMLGTAIAQMAGRHPRLQPAMETIGGILLIVGFVLIGYALQCALGGAFCALPPMSPTH